MVRSRHADCPQTQAGHWVSHQCQAELEMSVTRGVADPSQFAIVFLEQVRVNLPHPSHCQGPYYSLQYHGHPSFSHVINVCPPQGTIPHADEI